MTPRFFVSVPLSAGQEVALPHGAARHAFQVLRLRAGDALTLFDGSGGEYGARIRGATARGVEVLVTERRSVERESPLEVTLAQALIAADRMDSVIQKAVELGVAEIAPLATARAVTRLDDDRAQRRVEHWRQIAVAACEQCGRNRLPRVHAPCELRTWLERSSGAAPLRLLAAPSSARSLAGLARPDARVQVLVGPEGGFSPEEEAAAIGAGFVAVRLGPRILRTETAGPAMLAAMNALWGDWR